MKEHFNNLIKDVDDCGEALIGHVSDFTQKMHELTPDQRESYFKSMIDTGILDESAGEADGN